jgi:hypothetical protein
MAPYPPTAPLTENELAIETAMCRHEPFYFVDRYCRLYNAQELDWVPFHLWPAQAETIDTVRDHRRVVILKARQLGFTWLLCGYALWLMLFRPAATVLIFSRRDDEAVDILDFRLKGMHERLPDWMRQPAQVDGKHLWVLATGSQAMAFPTTGGRSYTATLVIVDEADFVPDLGRLLNAVKPTVDAGGQLVLLSTADKSRPESQFKKIFRAASDGRSSYESIFYGWSARPDRTPEWYAEQRRDCLENTGALDDLHQEYPASAIEAMAARTLDKRIPPDWIEACWEGMKTLADAEIARRGGPAINGLVVYEPPQPGREYVMGADPAEGNPGSDESALAVLDAASGAEVACLAGRYEPGVFAAHTDAIGKWYSHADVLPERNNHGHAMLLWLRDNSALTVLCGHDGGLGWMSSTKGKALLYDDCAAIFRERQTVIRSMPTLNQLLSVEGATLRAPEGMPDDRADAYALACVAVRRRRKQEADAGWPMAFGRSAARRR